MKPFENVNAKLLDIAIQCEEAGMREAAVTLRRASDEIDRLRHELMDRDNVLLKIAGLIPSASDPATDLRIAKAEAHALMHRR